MTVYGFPRQQQQWDAETAPIVSQVHTLGMDLIAKGIETQEQAGGLRSLGCKFDQGYYWAKPMPAPEDTELLQRCSPSRLRSPL